MNGRFKSTPSTSSEKFGSAGPTMAMEVPAPPQGVIGSVCGWLYGVFGPGNIKQDHIRTLIGDASSASNVALSDELERLARLHEQRLLTADEFALAKKVALLDVGNELKAQGRPSPKKARVGEGTGRSQGRSRSPPPATDASASAGYD